MCTFPSASWNTCFLFRCILELPNAHYKTAGTFTLHLYTVLDITKRKQLLFYCPLAIIDQNSVEKGTQLFQGPTQAQVGFIVGFVMLLHEASKLLHLHSRQQEPNASLYSINHSHTLSFLPHEFPKCSQLLKCRTESCT